MALFNLNSGFNYSNLSSLTKEFIDKLIKLPKVYCLKILIALPNLKFPNIIYLLEGTQKTKDYH